MNMIKTIKQLIGFLFFGLMTIGLFSCATVKKGSVEKKLDERVVQVKMHDNQLNVGDMVRFYKWECEHVDVRPHDSNVETSVRPQCVSHYMGLGRVSEVLTKDTALIETEEVLPDAAGVKFRRYEGEDKGDFTRETL